MRVCVKDPLKMWRNLKFIKKITSNRYPNLNIVHNAPGNVLICDIDTIYDDAKNLLLKQKN